MNFPEYLYHPDNVKNSLKILENKSTEKSKSVIDLFKLFNYELGIKSGDFFPISRIFSKGEFYRARPHLKGFNGEGSVSDIGVKTFEISQGRANPKEFPVFYGASSKHTAAIEVLQDEDPGIYEMTMGVWTNPLELKIVNLVDRQDVDFNEISFAHSNPLDYIKMWPDFPKMSATLLFSFFREQFKMKKHDDLYKLTNVLAGMLYCLEDIDGICYASVSNKFKGVNFAVKNYKNLSCQRVERWRVKKDKDDFPQIQLLEEGQIEGDLKIKWS